MTKPVYQGIWPVAPTPFSADGVVDYEGMIRVLDCMTIRVLMVFAFLQIFQNSSSFQMRNVSN